MITEADLYCILAGLFIALMIFVPLTCYAIGRAIERAYEQGRLDERLKPLPEEWL